MKVNDWKEQAEICIALLLHPNTTPEAIARASKEIRRMGEMIDHVKAGGTLERGE